MKKDVLKKAIQNVANLIVIDTIYPLLAGFGFVLVLAQSLFYAASLFANFPDAPQGQYLYWQAYVVFLVLISHTQTEKITGRILFKSWEILSIIVMYWGAGLFRFISMDSFPPLIFLGLGSMTGVISVANWDNSGEHGLQFLRLLASIFFLFIFAAEWWKPGELPGLLINGGSFVLLLSYLGQIVMKEYETLNKG